MEWTLPTSRVCQSCERFVVEASSTDCPDCGGTLRVTFLPPPDQAPIACQARGFDRSDWEREYAHRSEPIEQPIKSRLTQIGAGLGIQASVFETGLWIIKHTHSDLFAGVSHPSELTSVAIPLYLVATVLGLFVLSTLVGGGAAGAWCINWALQGIGVGVGFLAIIAAKFLLFVPWSLLPKFELPPMLFAMLAVAALMLVTLTTVGALLGHLLIRPIRVPLDAVR